jgi:hypothetical protein
MRPMLRSSANNISYYFTERPADRLDDPINAFPPGFRMVAGNNMKRAWYNGTANQVRPPYKDTWTQHDIEQQAIMEYALGFNCLHYNAGYNEDSLARHGLPDKHLIDNNCTDGVRAEIMFPSCWNGRDLDTENHADHVAYPPMLRNGPCPAGFDVRLPPLFFETIYWTPLFKDMDGEYIFANGDPTGFGYHADFINGWEDGVLQAAIDNPECTHPNSSGEQSACPVLDIKPDEEIVNCKMNIPDVLQAEQVNYVATFPGDVGIYRGPEYAPVPGNPVATSPIEPTVIASAPPTSTANPSPVNSTTISTVAPTTSADVGNTAGSSTLTPWSYYHVDGNKTTEVVVFQTVVTVTVGPSLLGKATSTAPFANSTEPAAPAKRRRHGHGRVHV